MKDILLEELKEHHFIACIECLGDDVWCGPHLSDYCGLIPRWLIGCGNKIYSFIPPDRCIMGTEIFVFENDGFTLEQTDKCMEVLQYIVLLYQ